MPIDIQQIMTPPTSRDNQGVEGAGDTMTPTVAPRGSATPNTGAPPPPAPMAGESAPTKGVAASPTPSKQQGSGHINVQDYIRGNAQGFQAQNRAVVNPMAAQAAGASTAASGLTVEQTQGYGGYDALVQRVQDGTATEAEIAYLQGSFASGPRQGALDADLFGTATQGGQEASDLAGRLMDRSQVAQVVDANEQGWGAGLNRQGFRSDGTSMQDTRTAGTQAQEAQRLAAQRDSEQQAHNQQRTDEYNAFTAQTEAAQAEAAAGVQATQESIDALASAPPEVALDNLNHGPRAEVTFADSTANMSDRELLASMPISFGVDLSTRAGYAELEQKYRNLTAEQIIAAFRFVAQEARTTKLNPEDFNRAAMDYLNTGDKLMFRREPSRRLTGNAPPPKLGPGLINTLTNAGFTADDYLQAWASLPPEQQRDVEGGHRAVINILQTRALERQREHQARDGALNRIIGSSP